VSVGLVKEQVLLDLNYQEDSSADVDMNVGALEGGQIVEAQATAEGRTYTKEQLGVLTDTALAGIADLIEIQRTALQAADVDVATLIQDPGDVR
jgi:ribonuclease PH